MEAGHCHLDRHTLVAGARARRALFLFSAGTGMDGFGRRPVARSGSHDRIALLRAIVAAITVVAAVAVVLAVVTVIIAAISTIMIVVVPATVTSIAVMMVEGATLAIFVAAVMIATVVASFVFLVFFGFGAFVAIAMIATVAVVMITIADDAEIAAEGKWCAGLGGGGKRCCERKKQRKNEVLLHGKKCFEGVSIPVCADNRKKGTSAPPS